MVMINCPNTGAAIPTGIETNRDSFRSSAVFFARTFCPNCRTTHEWFAKNAWVQEPKSARTALRHEAPWAGRLDGNQIIDSKFMARRSGPEPGGTSVSPEPALLL